MSLLPNRVQCDKSGRIKKKDEGKPQMTTLIQSQIKGKSLEMLRVADLN